jgi:hypothetical protein
MNGVSLKETFIYSLFSWDLPANFYFLDPIEYIHVMTKNKNFYNYIGSICWNLDSLSIGSISTRTPSTVLTYSHW